MPSQPRPRPATTVAGLHQRDAWVAPFVERALNTLVAGGAVTSNPYTLELWVVYVARKAFAAGRQSVMLEAKTATEVAAELGVHRTTVFRWARERSIGWRVGRDVLLGGADVAELRRLKGKRR